MISKGDDYPIHQTPEPVQQVFTSDRNFYDRFFFNGYFREGEPYFAAAMGIYPNVGIIDAAFSVIVGGTQHCVRASRKLGSDRLDTRVGPISIEIGEPMRSVRLRVDHPEMKAELEFQARAHAIEEPRFFRRNPENGRLLMDLTRFTQHGGWVGNLAVGGVTHNATPSRVWGSRDRSWGVRPVGQQAPGVPDATPFHFFWLWAPTNFEDVCTHFDVNENPDGSRWHEFGAFAKADPAIAPDVARAVDWNIDYLPKTRHAKRAEIIISAGEENRVQLETLYNFYMHGIGYGHPKWGHGYWVGDDVSTYEAFKLSEVNETEPLHQHIQAVCRAKLGAREGMGILEMMILGPHAKSGFKEILDMHR
ncbi:MAG TPA: hypothetical protein VKR29_01255 [Candidatus Binataceae bacterium]|nr:hypothetical protein [Candidatus Binataceae bacterium]